MKDNTGWLMIICWINEILDSRKFDDTKIFFDTDDKLADDITFKKCFDINEYFIKHGF